MSDDGLLHKLERQRRACAAMGSQLYANLLQHAIDDYTGRGPLFSFIAADERRAAMSMPGLRLLGALHFLALDGTAPAYAAHLPSCGGDGDADAAWSQARMLLESHEREIAVHYARTPQTNEVARSTVLLAGASWIAERAALPLRLFDVGASAGLNARLDCYRYEGDGWSWGDPRSPLVLRNSTRGGRPKLVDGSLEIAERYGCDMHPLDIGSARDRLCLLSYIWADQLPRIERLNAAFAAARGMPMRVDRADMFAWVAGEAQPRAQAATVVMHSVVLDHLSPEERERFASAIAGLGASARPDAPLAWLRMEMDEQRKWFETRVTLWPHGEEALIARSDGHGQEITWIA